MPESRQEILDLETLWGIRDIAEHFDISEQEVRTSAERGSIPGCTKALGRFVFDKEVVLAGWKPALRAIIKEGPGSPGFAKESIEPFLLTLVDAVTLESWKDICTRAIEQAKAGDRYARTWISAYLMGKPVTRVASKSVSTHRTEFSNDDRAAVVAALLEAANIRENESSEVEPDRETADRRPGPEQPTVDASPSEHSTD